MYVNMFCSMWKISVLFLKYNFFSSFSTLRIPLTLHFILLWVTKSSYTVLFIITFGKRGATWLLMWATWYLPAGCPMGNLIFPGVVKACSMKLIPKVRINTYQATSNYLNQWWLVYWRIWITRPLWVKPGCKSRLMHCGLISDVI